MANRRIGKGPQQPALIADPADRKRRVEIAIDKAIRAARADASLVDVDAGAYTLARELARIVDYSAAVKHDPYAVAAASRELREVLHALRLTPRSRDTAGVGDLEQLLTELAKPTVEPASSA